MAFWSSGEETGVAILQASAPPQWLMASARGSPAWRGQFASLEPAENWVWGGLLGLNALRRAQGGCQSVPGDGERLLLSPLPPCPCCIAVLTLVPSVLLWHYEQACKTSLIPLSGTSALFFEI